MAILVDQARWPWRGNYWCHLVTDTDLSELHEFAEQLGCRRVGFQGDHYDIDVETRERAIELGATELDSRDLVRRMKAAGLRLRPSQFTKWSLVTRGDSGAAPPAVFVPSTIAPYVDQADGFFVLERVRDDGSQAQATVIFGYGDVDLPAEDPANGFFVRIDREGGWSIESISPPPTPQE